MALLTALIPEQNLEKVRDRIATVLALELTAQAAMVSPPTDVPGVFVGRYTGIDDTETSMINITMLQGDYSNKHQGNRDGSYLYYIDCCVSAKNSDSTRADLLATQRLDKLLGQVMTILEAPVYKTLGFQAPSLSRTYVSAIRKPDPSAIADATMGLSGRVEFMVVVAETTELITPILIGEHFTVVKMSVTNKGYLWGVESNFTNIEKARDMKMFTFEINDTNATFTDEITMNVTDALPNNAIVQPLLAIGNDVINNWSSQGITRNTSTKVWDFTARGGVQKNQILTLFYEIL